MALTKISGDLVKVGTGLSVGIITATTVQVGSATTIHTTGIDLGSGNITSHNINSTGIITSTSFVGPVTGNVSSSGANTLGSLTVTNDATVGGALTVTGDLTVNGTTTTIDTAVTAVDSLAIDGDASVGGALTATGNITANAFYGDGSNLTGIDATQIVTGNTSVQTVDTGSDGHVKVNTEGTERLRIDSIGQISLRGTSTAFDGTGDLSALQMYYETDSGQASIGPYSSGGSTHLSFYTNSGGGAATEKLRITSSGEVRVPDSGKFTCGASDDLQIYHNGTNNYIDANGDFYLRVNNGTETSLYATANGKVALNYDNNNKFETTSTGATVNGTLVTSGTGGGAASLGSHLDLGDNQEARFGASDDLKIYHNASSSFIDNQTNHLYIRNNANDSDIYIQTDDGSGSLTNYIICDGSNGEVTLRHYGTQKLKTHTNGTQFTGNIGVNLEPSATYPIMTQAATRYQIGIRNTNADANYPWLVHDTDSSKSVFLIHFNGLGDRQKFYEDGKFVTSNYGSLGDYGGQFSQIRVGADIWGNTIKVVNDTNMNITANNGIYFNTGASTNGTDGGTTRAYVNSTGFLPATNNTYDLGTSSLRWRNVYTNDLNLSNEGSTNDVDGTWGNYTIQEGEDDLFLINRRSGKKYKFMLQEVN